MFLTLASLSSSMREVPLQAKQWQPNINVGREILKNAQGKNLN